MKLRLTAHRNPPTRIPRRPLRGQLSLSIRPRERLARRRRRAKIRAIFLSVVFVATMAWSAGLISHQDRFAILDVEIRGASATRARLVRAAFDVSVHDGTHHHFSRESIFSFPRRDIERGIAATLPRIKNVTISRDSLFAQAVRVSIEERIPMHTWCAPESSLAPRGEMNNECYIMDENGFVFARRDNEKTKYIFRGGLITKQSPIGQTFLNGRLHFVTDLFDLLGAADLAVLGAEVESENDFSVQLLNGIELKIPFGEKALDLVRDLKLAMSSDTLRDSIDNIEYIDLRFGNRIYYKLIDTGSRAVNSM